MTEQRASIQLFTVARDEPVRWRLLSGNNREIGRGTQDYVDADEARTDIPHRQRQIPQFATKVRRADANKWVWEVQLDGEEFASSGHQFDRMIRCQQALAQFLAQLPSATIRTSLVVSGARRWTRDLV